MLSTDISLPTLTEPGAFVTSLAVIFRHYHASYEDSKLDDVSYGFTAPCMLELLSGLAISSLVPEESALYLDHYARDGIEGWRPILLGIEPLPPSSFASSTLPLNSLRILDDCIHFRPSPLTSTY